MIKFGYCAGHGSFKDIARKVYSTAGKRTPDGEPEWKFNNIVAVAFANELSKYDGITLKRFDDPTGTDGANAWGQTIICRFITMRMKPSGEIGVVLKHTRILKQVLNRENLQMLFTQRSLKFMD